MAKFNKVNLEIRRLSGYGQYLITAKYKGKEVKARTTDSECYDWLNNDSNRHLHLQAKRHAYEKIVHAYNNIK